MSKSNTTENDVIQKIFHDVDFSWDAETDLWIALHTADPGEAGSQTTSECAYGSYARQQVMRDATGWDVSGNQALNDDLISFPECTSGSETITHVSVGTAPSGAGQILYSGALNAPRSVSAGITPQFAANGLTVQEE